MVCSWHQAHLDFLLKEAKEGTLAHAWLCDGPEGLGKRVFVDNVAQALLCLKSSNGACGQCQSCQCFAAKTHPDWFLVEPTTEAGSIGIDQIRQLSDRLSRSAVLGKRQVVCISPAEAMQTSGMNALLKTLEEPPSEVFIFLIADRPSLLPMTLLSRLQRLRFLPPSLEEARAWLAANVQGASSEQAVLFALHLGQGAPFKALHYLQDEAMQSLHQSMLHWLVKRDEPWHLFAERWERREEAQCLASLMLQLLAECIKVGRGVQSPLLHTLHLPPGFKQDRFWQMHGCLSDIYPQLRSGSGISVLSVCEQLAQRWVQTFEGVKMEHACKIT